MTQQSHSNRREWVVWALGEYEARLTRYAARLLGDEDAARDVVQHAFLRLCDRLPEELGDRVAPWLFAVCRNRAMDTLRGRKHTEPLDSAGPGLDMSREPDPAEAAETRDLYARLSELVAALPAAQREAIDLWTEGFSYREIAEVTEQREGNVRVLVHRGLKRLREHPLTQRLLGNSADADGPAACRPRRIAASTILSPIPCRPAGQPET
ncbi:MAG: sigma-70 family RNA polymerase sigma factor [Pirellulales bacterium]|nr:sigma-70 family RNA polymerase sigma factor [Pirellulales bacterium]